MQVFVEFEIGVTPDQTHFIANNTQGKSKKYGMKHYIMSTIHATMVDTLQNTAIEISGINENSKYRIRGK